MDKQLMRMLRDMAFERAKCELEAMLRFRANLDIEHSSVGVQNMVDRFISECQDGLDDEDAEDRRKK